ncbi:MAG: XRE family transcriptional regulator [Deltaproteobacteria bacterium]|nr:XRE family transcriptional regulator [Deltaproteobacteria bacterium]
MDIFQNIKKIRKGKGITLKEISEKTGISVNYLSRLERGASSNPSIGVIKNITNVLGVPFMGLNGESIPSNGQDQVVRNQKVSIVRSNMRKMLIFPKSKLKQYLLTPDLQRKLEVLLGEVDPGDQYEEEWYNHEGEEFGLILEGQYEVTVENEVYILNEGDSIYFPSHLPHKMRGIGNKKCRTLWVITPPSF